MKDKILSIQNKAKSLMWGHHRHSETEDLYVVGHKSYPKTQLCFIVSDDYVVSLVDSKHNRESTERCESADEVLKAVYQLLKSYFPAKVVNV